ncbi:uncharacterized protein BDZ99DRAFT_202143 [Mytilinidion resinicola]|uniref:Uncharacterized protein n=1 Tax=Mytilinidion resinicola TaxID=574789 RepID=A0A6A6Y1F4_9PEZI|nr:uncharacterized protein BDZ99DRAFT_202143 [Mytilinidion resinicola]KAF2802378.1 hypothetical protein BDZ99DRAFT_202143 [Mytilinidion resinicola]
MSVNFLSLPSELRNKIYEEVLMDQEPIDPWALPYPFQPLTMELLRVNKTIHREASSLLYAQNRFDLTVHSPELVDSFLDKIGRNNASHIRHICISFPEVRYLDLHDVTLADDSDHILAKIQTDCINLRTLTTSLDSIYVTEGGLDETGSPSIVVETFALVDSRLRAIPSLQEIIVEVYEKDASAYVRREMESHGWTISVKENEELEEWYSDRSFSDMHGDDDHSSYDGGDDYDIDNDSDFWRRAGD